MTGCKCKCHCNRRLKLSIYYISQIVYALFLKNSISSKVASNIIFISRSPYNHTSNFNRGLCLLYSCFMFSFWAFDFEYCSLSQQLIYESWMIYWDKIPIQSVRFIVQWPSWFWNLMLSDLKKNVKILYCTNKVLKCLTWFYHLINWNDNIIKEI